MAAKTVPTPKPNPHPGHPPANPIENQVPGKLVNLGPVQCISEDCKRKPSRAGFCDEHFTWFKEGLITADGGRAKDFDKKYHHWLRRAA
ncbi:MAG: hypothetical protein WCH11_06260 [Bdellovibrio sp.]